MIEMGLDYFIKLMVLKMIGLFPNLTIENIGTISSFIAKTI